MSMQNVMLVAQNSVEQRQIGVVTSLLTLTRTVGGAASVAILGTIFVGQLREDLTAEFTKLGPTHAAEVKGLDQSSILDGGGKVSAPVHHAIQAAADTAITHLFTLAIPFMLVALVATLAIRRDPLSDRAAISVVDEVEHELADLVPGEVGHDRPVSSPR
jgi:hypothetical protein